MKRLIWTLLSVFVIQWIHAQIVVTGKVLDAATKEPLIGVNITTAKENIATTTDIDGSYKLELTEPDSLSFYYIGYKPNQAFLKISGNYDIKLYFNNNELPTFLVNAQRLGTTYVTPNVASIRPEDLVLDNQTSLAPVLNRIAGVFVHNGTFSTNRITIRGIGNRSPFGTNKIRAYLNDIPLTNGVGETTLEDLDWDIFQSIDVLRGPTSGLYGAGLGGLIHLKTDFSQDNQLEVTNTVGSYGLQRNTAKLQIKSKNNVFSFGLNRTNSDGYRENNEYDRLGIYFLSFWKLKSIRISTLFNHIDLKAFIPSSINFSDYQNAPQKAAFIWANVKGFEDYQRTLLGVTAAFDVSNDIKNTTTLFGSFYSSYESRPFNILLDTSKLLGVRTTFEWNPNTKFQIQLGSEAFGEQYNWQTYSTNAGIQGNLLSDNQEQRTQVNVFLQTQIRVSKHWLLQAGLSYNYTSYQLEDQFLKDTLDRSGDYAFDPIVSPYLSTVYSWEHGVNRYKWYLVWSYGFSPPTLEETLTPSGAINRDIQPERGWNYETGINGSMNFLDWRIVVYTMRIQDLLVARRTDFDQFIGINAGKTIHNGIELEARAKLLLKKISWSPFLNYTYSNYTFDTFVDGNNDYSGNNLTGTSPHLLTSGLVGNWKGITGNINFQFADSMPIRDDNSLYSEVYDLWNMRLDYRFSVAKHWEVVMFAGINNIWDEKYASMLLINANSTGTAQPRYYYPGLPRNYYGGVRIVYRWQ